MMCATHCWVGSKRFQNNLENMILLLTNKAWKDTSTVLWIMEAGEWSQGWKRKHFAFYASVLWVFLNHKHYYSPGGYSII